MDWTLVNWPRLVGMTAGLTLLAPFAHFVDRRLHPALQRLDVGPNRERRLRRLAQVAIVLALTLLALWGAGLSLNQTLLWLGGQPVSGSRLGLFLVGLALSEGLSRLLGYLLERRAGWIEASQQPAVAHLVRWGLRVVLGLSLLGWLGVSVRSPMLTIREQGISLFQLAVFCVYVAAVLIGGRVLGSLVERRLLARTRLARGARYAVGRLTNYAILVIGLVTSLDLLGVRLGSVTVLLGALGVGIGFGLQNIVNNFVSGLLLLIERPLQIGDFVEVYGSRGRVTRIGGRSTTVRTPENIAVVIPNGELIANKLTNWTQADAKTRVGVALRVAVGTDVEELKALLLASAASHPNVLGQPAPQLAMRGFDETGVDLELQVWIDARVTQPAGLLSDLYFSCYGLFQEKGFQVPRPTIRLTDRDDLETTWAASTGTSRP